MIRSKAYALVMVIGCLGSGAAPAWGQSGAAPSVTGNSDKPWNAGVLRADRTKARDLFLEGNDLFTVPLFAQAAEKYAAALARWKHPAFYFNLALAQLNLGDEVAAHDNLLHALQYGQEPLGEEQYEEAKRQRETLENKLGRLRVSYFPADALVTIDGVGRTLAADSAPVWVKAGEHEIRVVRQGYLSQSTRVQVEGGESAEVVVRLVTFDGSRRWKLWKPWAVVGAGVAVGVVGAGLHALSSRNFSAYDAEFLQLDCVREPDPESPGCTQEDIPPQMDQRLGRARIEQATAVGGYIVGGALLATGIVLVYMNMPQLDEQRGSVLHDRGIRVSPEVSATAVGLVVELSY